MSSSITQSFSTRCHYRNSETNTSFHTELLLVCFLWCGLLKLARWTQTHTNTHQHTHSHTLGLSGLLVSSSWERWGASGMPGATNASGGGEEEGGGRGRGGRRERKQEKQIWPPEHSVAAADQNWCLWTEDGRREESDNVPGDAVISSKETFKDLNVFSFTTGVKMKSHRLHHVSRSQYLWSKTKPQVSSRYDIILTFWTTIPYLLKSQSLPRSDLIDTGACDVTQSVTLISTQKEKLKHDLTDLLLNSSV